MHIYYVLLQVTHEHLGAQYQGQIITARSYAEAVGKLRSSEHLICLQCDSDSVISCIALTHACIYSCIHSSGFIVAHKAGILLDALSSTVRPIQVERMDHARGQL